MIAPARIDTFNNTINAEIKTGGLKDSLKPSFVLSSNSHAWIGNQEQVSDVNYMNFSDPVLYDVVSNDSQIIKKWIVTVLDAPLSLKAEKWIQSGLKVYPNPSDGNFNLHFSEVKTSSSAIDIFNTMGEKVYTELIKGTGDFTVETNLKKLPVGVYIVRYSETEKPEFLVIKKN